VSRTAIWLDRIHGLARLWPFLRCYVVETAVFDERSRLRVVTLRADFTDRPLQYVDFGELVRQRTEFVLPLSPDELEEAITRPVTQLG
jgi:hypothetical protein